MKRGWPQLVNLKMMWPRFLTMFKYQDLNEFGKNARFNEAFLRHHRNACTITFSKDGRPLFATYYTPEGMSARHVDTCLFEECGGK